MPYHDPNATLLPSEFLKIIKKIQKKLGNLPIDEGLRKRIITRQEAETLRTHEENSQHRRIIRTKLVKEHNQITFPKMLRDQRANKARRNSKHPEKWLRDIEPRQILERFESTSKSRPLTQPEISKLRAFLISSNPQTRERASQAVRAIKQNRGNVRQRELRKRMQKPRKA